MGAFAAVESDILAQLNGLQGAAASQAFATFAAEQRDIVVARDHPTGVTQTVDGREGATLESVKPVGGIVLFEFSYLLEIAQAIQAAIFHASPFRAKRPGADPATHYRDQNILFLNGAQIDKLPERLAPGDELVFTNLQPYARKIEKGVSLQAPDGVYEQIGRMMKSRYGKVAAIDWSYRHYLGAGPLGPASRRSSERGRSQDDRFPTITLAALDPKL